MKALAFFCFMLFFLFIFIPPWYLAVIFFWAGVILLMIPNKGKKGSDAAARIPRAEKKSGSFFNSCDIQVPGAPAVDAYAFRGTQEDYFYRLLIAAFPEYIIRRNVAVEDLFPQSFMPGKQLAPVSFLLSRDGKPKLALMLGLRSECESDSYTNTLQSLKAHKIPVQHYINTFRNKASYVYLRVQDGLK